MYIKRGLGYKLRFLSRGMTRQVTFLLLFISCFWLSGCHDDDHHSFTNREVNEVIYEKMKEWYLWYDELPAPGKLDFETSPENFYSSLLLEKDGKNGIPYSFIVSGDHYNPGENKSLAYGMEYHNSSLQVMYITRHGPAEKSGIKRGDVLKALEGVPLTADNVVATIKSHVGEVTVTVERWNEETGREEELDIVLAKREWMYFSPIGTDTIYTGTNVGKVGYLVYREFISGPDEDTLLYNNELKRIFKRYQAAGIRHLVLDLRDNPGGELDVCRLLCTMFAPGEAMGKVFLTGRFNEKHEDNVILFDVDEIEGGGRLDLEKLIVIVNQNTASAGELVIHCLRPYLGDRLQVVGTRTHGKNVGMSALCDVEVPWIIVPVTFYLLNCEGKCDYVDGLKPDVYIEEDFSKRIYPLGDRREVLLQKAMQTIGAE